jgi:hypothetical protein
MRKAKKILCLVFIVAIAIGAITTTVSAYTYQTTFTIQWLLG